MLIKQTDAAGNESNESTLDTVIIDGLTGTAAADSLDAFDITNDDEQTIFGLAGDDSMTGADGDDLFIGGEGDDELRGEGGSDTFLYLNANDGSDLIRSFEIGSGGDKLVFGNWLGSLTLSDDGENNLKITAGAVSVTLESVDYANAHAIGDAVWLAQMQTNGNLVIL
jgi:Ca2+-binding RTX toxin-like protein